MNFPELFIPSDIPSQAPGRNHAALMIGGLSYAGEIRVTSDERSRAMTMRDPASRDRFLKTRNLLRKILSRWLDVDPEKVGISVGDSGKPFLIGAPPLHFSISHSQDFIVIAFCGSEIGVDLEKERPIDTVALARRFFTSEEAEKISEAPFPDLFFRHWTCREAAIKADGRGLAALLGSTRVTKGWGQTMKVDIGEVNWSAVSWKTDCNYYGAVAFREMPSLISWCDLR